MFRPPPFVNTAEYLQILRDSPKIYQPTDFSPNEILELSRTLLLKYKDMVKITLNDAINNFGNFSSSDIVNLNFDDILPGNGYTSNHVINTVIAAQNDNHNVYWTEKSEICKWDHKFPFLSVPIFWQEIIILIYMSLKLYKNVKNGSRVIALGESPLKLVFIQQLFCTSPIFSKILTENHMATDIDYTYFSLSSVGLLVETKDMLNIAKTFDIDNYISMNNQNSNFSTINQNKLDYFKSNSLDPRYIIANNKKIYFQDRCETYRSIIALMFVYSKLCDMQDLTIADRLILYQNIYIIAFDSKLEDTPTVIIERINILIYKIITKDTNYTSEKDVHFININFRSKRAQSRTAKNGWPRLCVDNDYSIFTNQFQPIDKMIRFLSLPEFTTFRKSRCGKINNISRQINIDSEMMKNNKFEKGEQCNIINACIMILIYELGVDYISTMVKNVDIISEDRLMNTTWIDFHSIDMEIKEKLSAMYTYFINTMDGTDLNNNIFNNILLINQMKLVVITTIMNFISEHGVFSKCIHAIPLKTAEDDGTEI